jgi:hypothetical protein
MLSKAIGNIGFCLLFVGGYIGFKTVLGTVRFVGNENNVATVGEFFVLFPLLLWGEFQDAE